MTHPGMAFVFVVGIGLATILYYMFNDPNSNNNNPNQQSYSSHSSNNSNNKSNDLPNNPNVRSRYKRKGSTTSTDKENCTICLMEISVQQIVNVSPCGHPFHMKCIQGWQQQGQMESHKHCPICRRLIEKIC